MKTEAEKKDIENWGNKSVVDLNKEIDDKDMAANERNQSWWESMPMTYSDWDDENRIPTTKEDFDKINDIYFESNMYLRDNRELFKAFAGKEVLEIGCGAGSATLEFLKGGANARAVDLTEQATELTRANCEAHGFKDIDVSQKDAEKLEGIADKSLDFVYSWGVLHHSSKPENCYRQVHRVLKKDGKALLMVYHKISLRYIFKGLFWLFVKGKIFQGYNMERVQRFFTDGYYHKHYTKNEFAKILENIGFRVDEVLASHMNSKMIPLVPEFFRNYLKRKIGWLLVARISKL